MTRRVEIGVVSAAPGLGLAACGAGTTDEHERAMQSHGADYGLAYDVSTLTAGTPVGTESHEAVAVQESDLIPPMQKVLDEMLADGTDLEIVAGWGMEELAMGQTTLNAGTLDR